MPRQNSTTIIAIKLQTIQVGNFCAVICRPTDKKTTLSVLRIYIITNLRKKVGNQAFIFIVHSSQNFTRYQNKFLSFLQQKYSFAIFYDKVELLEYNGTFHNEAITLIKVILVGNLHYTSLKYTCKLASYTQIRQELVFFPRKSQWLPDNRNE